MRGGISARERDAILAGRPVNRTPRTIQRVCRAARQPVLKVKGVKPMQLPKADKVAEFLAANAKSPVVSGYAIESDPHKPAKGAVYTLADGTRWRLNVAECQAIGMPRWAI